MTTDIKEKQIIVDSYLKLVNDESSLHSLEILSKDNSDYKLVEKSIINTSSKRAKIFSKVFKIERICRIHKKHPEVKNYSTENVLFFHGTPRKNVEGILKHGFKPSES